MVPLPALLSQALVAFTIEADNELELRLPHITTTKIQAARKQSPPPPLNGPWLTSLVMWANFLQFVDGATGTPAPDVQHAAATAAEDHRTMLAGMTRWGYVAVDAAKPPVVRLTPAGRRAQELWPEVLADVEARWARRAGALRSALSAAAGPAVGPPFFPMVNYGNGLRVRVVEGAAAAAGADLGLAGALSQVLLAATLRYEREHEVSLALAANVLRVLTAGDDTLVADLPARTGTSKEAVTFSLGYLEKGGHLTVSGTGRAKAARLTARGAAAQDGYERWAASERDDALRSALEPLVAGIDPAGLAPPGTWRAALPPRQVLPHHPMVLHRGGYPDGS